MMAAEILDAPTDIAAEMRSNDRRRRRIVVRVTALVLWAVLIALESYHAAKEPSLLNIGVATAFVLLCISVSAQVLLVRWAGNRHWRRLIARMHGSNYLAEAFNLPNRNYLMSELRREMPQARQSGVRFFLVQVSLDALAEVRDRRGQQFADRALGGLATTLERICRTEFLAYLENGSFVIVVNETRPDALTRLLRAVPGAVPVSDGHESYDVLVSARVLPYDLESLYATDLMRDLEDAPPLRRRDQPFGAAAA